jgi:hypothetical protein
MNPQVRGLRVAAILFGLFSLAQLTRLIIRPEIVVAGHVLPLWPSMIAFPVLAALAIWLWQLSTKP